MVTTPYIPADAPFTLDQQAWLNGFFAGLNTRLLRQAAAPDIGTRTLQIAYGTQTGNAEEIAQGIASEIGGRGFQPIVRALDDLDPVALAAGAHLVIVVSTYGEGDMPDTAVGFWNRLNAAEVPRLDAVHYSVLALGDRSYEQFCRAGALIDERLFELGAHRLAERVELDVDYEQHVPGWWEAVFPLFEALEAIDAPVEAVSHSSAAQPRPRWTKRHPYPAEVSCNRRLSGEGSAKEIRHLEVDIAGSGLEYQAGDALGIMPVNDPHLVESLLEALGVDPEASCGRSTFAEELATRRELTTVGRELALKVAEAGIHPQLQELVAPERVGELDAYLWGRDVIDLVGGAVAAGLDAQAVVGWLRPLQHRAYSISSSPLAHPDSVHLTIATLRYETHGRRRQGACSTYLADRVLAADRIKVFTSPNSHFRVPTDPETPMIMVGPGTGVAPFRAFLQDRELTGAGGSNWLFFGDQHLSTDFIYASEWERFLSAGVLTRLDTAFSRDQRSKVYVQNRMVEQGRELYAWLEQGASFYVCGDAQRMAPDVEAALVQVVQTHGDKTEDQARDYLATMREQRRYLRDVY